MPIQIKELIIRATVDEGRGENKGNGPKGANATSSKINEEELVKRCVDEVMEVLRLQNER